MQYSFHCFAQLFSGFFFVSNNPTSCLPLGKVATGIGFARADQRWRAAMDGFKDCRVFTDIARSRHAESADEHAGFVAEDVAEQIGGDDDFKLLRRAD
jgi:hypothetical protein